MNKEQFLEWLGEPANYSPNERKHSQQIFLFENSEYPSILARMEVPVAFELLDSRHLGEGDWGGEEYAVYRFECLDGPLWVKFVGMYRSYNYDYDTDYRTYLLVTPQEKLITVYE